VANKFRATLMVAAISAGYTWDFRQDFVNFPVDDILSTNDKLIYPLGRY
jgi:hypothetical protein